MGSSPFHSHKCEGKRGAEDIVETRRKGNEPSPRVEGGEWRKVPRDDVKLTARSLLGVKGKDVPGAQRDRSSKGVSVESENVLRKGNLVMPGACGLRKYCHILVFINLSVPLLNIPGLLNEKATPGGGWGRYWDLAAEKNHRAKGEAWNPREPPPAPPGLREACLEGTPGAVCTRTGTLLARRAEREASLDQELDLRPPSTRASSPARWLKARTGR